MHDRGATVEATSAEDVLIYWYGSEDLDLAPPACVRRWFEATARDDEEIRARFGAHHARAAEGGLRAWESTPRGRLALILTFDQLSRHLHRATARAFEYDAEAVRLSREGIARGDDDALPALARAFFYMPLHHAEDPSAQEEAVRCFARLAADSPPALAELLRGFHAYAVEHADVVRRFGRFPHRNAVLGRTSTAAEQAYLAGGAATYGQSPAADAAKGERSP